MNGKTNGCPAAQHQTANGENCPDFYTNENGVLVFTNQDIVDALMNNPTHKSALMALVSVGKAEIPSRVIQ